MEACEIDTDLGDFEIAIGFDSCIGPNSCKNNEEDIGNGSCKDVDADPSEGPGYLGVW